MYEGYSTANISPEDDSLTIDKIQKAIKLIEKLPKPEPIEAILLTKLLDGIYRSRYEEKDYFLIGKNTWEQEVKPQLKEVEITNYSSLTQGIGAITGIPVVEDEELVREMLRAWAEQLGKDVLKGWMPE